jgi:calcyphosin
MPSAGVRTWNQVDKAANVRAAADLPPQTQSNAYTPKVEKSDEELLEYVRAKVVARGARGINGLRRVFKIMDDDGSRSLDRGEFAKAMQDYRITSDPTEVQRIFTFFDRDGSNTIDYDEFLRTVVGEMSDRRRALVLQAFRLFDRDGSGTVGLEDLKGRYNASQHPDVKTGRKTEEDVLYEFLDTFEQHHALLVSSRL